MELFNFLRWDPSNDKGRGPPHGSALEGEIWETFASDKAYLASIADAIRGNFSVTNDHQLDHVDQPDVTAIEGALLPRVNNQRERNPKLARRKKAQALEHLGRLECEVCRFDFVEKYGPDLGYGVIDCHHMTPLSELKPGTKTTPPDLALVCPNCHRILHKGGIGNTMNVKPLATALA